MQKKNKGKKNVRKIKQISKFKKLGKFRNLENFYKNQKKIENIKMNELDGCFILPFFVGAPEKPRKIHKLSVRVKRFPTTHRNPK